MTDSNAPALVFPDANVFLEYARLDDPRWRALFDGRPLTFEICVHTVSEVDALRRASRSRLRKRAREVTSWLMKNADGDGRLANGAEIDFVAGSPVGLLDRGDLDRHNPDDLLVASALRHHQEQPEGDVCVLSEDTGVVLKARGFGLRGVQPPADLRLPPEPAEEEKRIQQLERRLAEVEMGAPAIALQCKGAPTSISVNAFQTTEEEYVGEGVERARAEHAQGTDPAELAEYLEKYKAYRHDSYAGWSQVNRSFRVPLTLHNEGRAAATNIHLFLEAPSSIAFFTKWPESPKEPAPPLRRGQPPGLGSRFRWEPGMLGVPESIRTPWVSADWIIQPPHKAATTVKNLVHGLVQTLPTLYAWFTGEPHNFAVEWSAHVENAPEPFTGTLHFVSDESRSPDDLVVLLAGEDE